MALGKWALLYLVTAVVFFGIDFIWLSTATSRIYKPMLGDLLSDTPNLPVAGLFYLVYIVGLIALAIAPGLSEGNVLGALWRGALVGFLAYATYDLTNLATIRDWPWQIAAIDIVWGTALNSVTAVAGYYAGVWLGLGR